MSLPDDNRPVLNSESTIKSELESPGKAMAYAASFLLIYSCMMYFNAATASMGEAFQSDIYKLKSFSWPTLMLVATSVFTVFRRTATNLQLLRLFSAGAIAVCFFMLIIIYTNDVQSSAVPSRNNRTLSRTLHTSLANPNFSRRSYAHPFYGGIVAAAAFGVALSLSVRKPT